VAAPRFDDGLVGTGRLRFAPLLLLIGWLTLTAPARAEPRDLVWLDAGGRPNASARDALRLLADAGADGLSSRHYRAAELGAQADAAAAAPGALLPPAAFERDLSAAIRSYLHDVHLGRIDPRALGFPVAPARAAATDFATLLAAAVAAGHLPEAVAELRPKLGQYARLREALARYRVLAADATLVHPPFAATAKRGAVDRDGVALHRLLVALGDLPAAAPSPAAGDDATLAAGVGRFQSRHGLAVDGVLGRSTLAALNVPLAYRVQQLEWALERMRWLPDLSAQRFIAINIPMFRLWAWDPDTPDDATLSMKVVVGRALKTQTPVLFEEMHYLVFRPYWNVPRSIVGNEILPALANDPGYLQREDMEIVRGGSDDAKAVAASDENIAALRHGDLRLRQRPGPKNALGRVKFIFPNDANVYLHDTPAPQLFSPERRDFSHGCVRVDDPLALALWLLKGQPGWARDDVRAAMAGAPSRRVDLVRPLPVILFYATAMVMPADRTVHFADDLYGHDSRLARALDSRRPLNSPSSP